MIPFFADATTWPLGTFLFGALAFFISLGTLSVAIANYKTSADKLRLDLFERRYRIYRSVVRLIDTIGERGIDYRAVYLKFYKATRHHRFLFKQDIHQFIADLKSNYMMIQNIYHKIHAVTPKGSPWPDHFCVEKKEVQEWFDKLRSGGELVKLFEPYLAFYNTSNKLLSIEENLR